MYGFGAFCVIGRLMTRMGEKQEKEERKGITLLDIIAGVLIIIFACSFTLAIGFANKWAYILLLLTSITILIFLWNEEISFFKIYALIMVLYSILGICGLNSVVIAEYFGGNILLLGILAFVELLAIHSWKLVLVFIVACFCFRKFVWEFIIKGMFKEIKMGILNRIYGPLPRVHGIVKRDKKVYFHKNYKTNEIQTIYRQGHKKKIIDTDALDEKFYTEYSLKWDEENYVIIQKYNIEKHKLISEKKCEL